MAKEIQNYTAVDSTPTDPFEALVAMYYQLQGYVTSSNKWFWVREDNKKQRGYQDIDVLAIKENKTLIVSVTTNLDDKVGVGRDHRVKPSTVDDLRKYFERVEKYLKGVKDYKWLAEQKKKRMLAYAYGRKKTKEIEEALKKEQIELISAKEIIEYLEEKIPEIKKKGLRTNNPLVKLTEFWLKWSKGKKESP